MAETQASSSMTPEQKEHAAYVKQLDWDLFNLSEVLSSAIKTNKAFDDVLQNELTYRQLWLVYNRAFSLKGKEWIADTTDKTQTITDLKSSIATMLA